MPDKVRVLWINGKEDEYGPCGTIGEVRANVCKRYNALWPQILLLSSDFKVMNEDNLTLESPYVGSSAPSALTCGASSTDEDAFSSSFPLSPRHEPLRTTETKENAQPSTNSSLHVVLQENEIHSIDTWIHGALQHALHDDGSNLLRMYDHLREKNIVANPLDIFGPMWLLYWERKPQGNASVVEAMSSCLLPVDMDIRVPNRNDYTPLYLAATHGALETVRALVEVRANMNLGNGQHHETALHAAVQGGKTAIVAALLEKGAKPNVTNRMGETALHKAAANGNLRTVRNIIEFEGNVNQRTKNGYLPLHHALYNGFFPVVRALVEAGATIDERAREIAAGQDVNVKSIQSHSKVNVTIRWAQSDSRNIVINEFLRKQPMTSA